MTHEELEHHKRRLDEELRTGIALLEAAHRHQMRALELVWKVTSDEALALPVFPAPPEEARQPLSTPAPPIPPTPPPPARRGAWQLLEDVESALQRLTGAFDRNDLCRALGYQPDRGSLYRALQDLVEEGKLSQQVRGSGKVATTYVKTGGTVPPSVP